MLLQSGEARDGGADRRLAWSLAGIAGALNAAGFYAVGVFSSNMTGNVSSLADHLALADLAAAAPYLGLVAAFISGAAVSAGLVNAGRRRRMAHIYALSILAEAALLTGLASADLWLTGTARAALLAYGLSFLMGLQNAVVTRISNARVRTTHVTGMVTDIGIELGNLLDRAWHRRQFGSHDAEADYNAGKLLLHGVTVLAFLGGGVSGVLAYRQLGPLFLFGAALLLLLLALPGILGKAAGPMARHRAD
jgi:uncharacterized membrane protein YoaK (UPF0700 family)